MPQYAYRAVNNAGRQVRGKLSANNETDLFQQLQNLGLVLVDSKTAKDKGGKSGGGKLPAREKIQFLVHLEQLQAAGVPLIDSLTDVRDSADTSTLRDLVSNVINDVSGGTPLSEAFQKHPRTFSDIYPALIAVGEESGKLQESFAHLVEHTKWEDELRTKIKKASQGPLIGLVMISGMLMFMMGAVVPQIVEFLRANGQTLPAVTVALIATSDFIRGYWWVILAAPIALFVAISALIRASDAFRYAFSCFVLRLPVLGDLVGKLAISRFAHFFAVMFQSGVPILQCLESSQRVAANTCIEEALKVVRQQVQNGEPLSQAMKGSGQFPSLVCRMVKIGEDSGNLGGVLDNVTSFYDKDVDEAIDAMIGMIQPAITVFTGGVMAWIIVGVMGPIYDSLGKLGV
jgi:type IV pilus assembly protein PilC